MKKLVLYAYIFLSLLIIGRRIYTPWQPTLQWDTFGYYLYLPATFIYNDPGLQQKEKWLDPLLDKYKPTATFYQAERLENGKWALRYPIGWAVMNAPFFFAGHLTAKITGHPQDGLSKPYSIWILIGGTCYVLFGLWLFCRFLLFFFDERTTLLTLLLTVLATNYYQISTGAVALTHSYLFTLYAVFFYGTYRWHIHRRIKYVLMVGISTGLIAITRPNEALLLGVFFLWNIYSFDSFLRKMQLLFANKLQIILMGICIAAVVSIQLLYWKYASGKWFFYSYRDPAVGFDFKSPHTFNFLFSFRKGWFIYTPVMFFALLGILAYHKQLRSSLLAISSFFILNLYVVSSWTCWWYAGGSYSSRSLVPCYVFLALGLGYLIRAIREYDSRNVKILFACLAIFFTGLNLFQDWQFAHGILDGERITANYYFRVFGKTAINDEDRKLLLVPRSTESEEHIPADSTFTESVLYEMNFSNDTLKHLQLDSNRQFSPGPDIAYKDITLKEYAWLQCEAEVFIPEDYEGPDPLLVVSFHYKDQPYKYRSTEKLNQVTAKGQWIKLHMDYQTPEVRSKQDNLKVYLWHRGKMPVYLRWMKVQKKEPR